MIKNEAYKNGNLCYRDEGEGKTIVLLHGYLESLHTWNLLYEELTSNYRVIAMDLPGHGGSLSNQASISMDDMAEAVDFVIQLCGVRSFYLIGHSMGGYVALAYANKYIEKLKGLCLLHSAPFADTEEKRNNRDREIKLVQQDKKELLVHTNIPKMFATDNVEHMQDWLEYAKAIANQTDSQGIIGALEGMKKRRDQTLFLAKLPIPLLVILGKKDNYIDYDAFMKNVKLPAKAHVVSLENAGHMGFYEENEKVLEEIEAFVEGND